MKDAIKEVVVDVFLLFTAWFLITAGNMTHDGKGVTCGRAKASETADSSGR